MFGKGDKITLTVKDIKDSYGTLVPTIISMPIKDTNILESLDSVREASVFEYHEGRTIFGNESFRILVGGKTSLNEIIKHDDIRNFRWLIKPSEIDGIDSPICYNLLEDGTRVVFSAVSEGDVIVSNLEEFKDFLWEMSVNFSIIKKKIEYLRTI